MASNFRKLFLAVLVAFCCVIFLSIAADAADVTVAWDHPGDVDGYQLFVRKTTEQFDFNVPAWTGAELQHKLTGLEDGIEYGFVVRAYIGTSTSPNSNEIIYTTTSAPEVIKIPQRPSEIRILFQ